MMFRGMAADPAAAQDLRDSYSRRLEPSQVLTKERLQRWSVASGESSEGRRRVGAAG